MQPPNPHPLLRRLARHLSCAAWLLGASAAQAFSVGSVSPQGEVAQARQVVVKFSEAAVRFGDAQAAAPFTLHCNDEQAARGTGRWTGEREWVYDFARALPPGVRCALTPVPGFRSPAGVALKSAAGYTFQTGGPAVQRIRPHDGGTIEEDQVFVLRLTGPATRDSVKDKVWCSLPDVGERVPVRLLDGAPRAALLKALGLGPEAEAQTGQWLALQCQRRFTPGTGVKLVYGAGVATPSGIINRVEKRFAFTVREPFNAEMSCERENAQAACMPIRPVTLRFSAPVPRAQAERARLRLGDKEIRPQSVADGDDKLGADSLVEAVRFAAPLAENAAYTLTVPPDLQDASGRALANGPSFPLTVRTGPMPPLAKFAAAPFGIVERFADGPDGTPALPVTLRRVEAGLAAQAMQVSRMQATEDADIIAWLRRVERYDETLVPREQAARDAAGPLPPPADKDDPEGHVEARAIPLLAGRPHVQTLALPGAAKDDPRPFEVVGIPLTPGFHVLEIGSKTLGSALLNDAYGADRTLYVRTAALVTNLGVHFKLGRENALAWVTTLDKGQPVPGARVRVSDCKGRLLAEATTDAQGITRFQGLSPDAPTCHGDGLYGDTSSSYFVSARATDHGVADMAFTWSGWQRGIEPWRFNVPTDSDATPGLRAHTVFDRTLLRAGETLSMKHFARTETGPAASDGPAAQGAKTGTLALPAQDADTLLITHVGSGQEFTQPLTWQATATGGRSAASQFAVPSAAKLGLYRVALKRGHEQIDSGQFRVEEFRLPVFKGSVGVAGKAPLVAPASVPVQVQLGYVSGGPAAGLPVRVSALLRAKRPRYAGHEDFSFAPPRPAPGPGGASSTLPDEEDGEGREGEDREDGPSTSAPRVVADKRPLTLDAHGNATLTLAQLPPASQPRELVLEASYADPSGEIQTLRGARTLWPAAVVAGIRAEGWVSVGRKLRLQALALDLDGQPKAGVPLTVRAVARVTTSSRKRMVGGFYAYDSHTETRDLGTVCTGSSDAHGLLACEASLNEPGEVELIASARDGDGRAVEAAQSVWVTRQGELWFGGENHDRMDVLAEKKHYAPGDTARFQVRMPFRQATALVAVEREGIVETQIVQLRGDNPTISLKVGEHWAPNVYVSVLALRGRLHHVPWYSFFTWGFKSPRQWWQAFWHGNQEHVPPTALVDLSKPAFRLGMAEIRVDNQAHRLQVAVKADQASYPVRGTARVSIEARLPGGQPAAHAEVAVAAVDQALLELMPNRSWNLLDAMLQRRAWGVGTATAQMEIVGRRHYGRKAVPAGGDGGGAPVRELLDTLLLWNPRVALDAQGRAQIDVPLNDALSTFQIVAVADSGAALFGTGQTAVRTTQDLQIISGLPPLVRGGDQFRATLTLRNTTAQPMKVDVTPRATLLDVADVAAQTVDLPAGQAREVHWDVTAPSTLAALRPGEILWEIEARDQTGGARDALRLSQRVVAAVPVAVQQATLTQLDGLHTLAVAPPASALPGRGGVHLALQPRLADGLPGVRDWFARYPYTCLEQKTSRAIGLGDEALWRQTAAQLPAYLDTDGLASYFPPRAGDGARGSDSLSAWLLAATHEAARLNPAFALPADARQQLITGLTRFVEGRIERRHWAPREDLDVRKLAAIEALSRHGAARASMLGSLSVAPGQWPTSAVIDWLNILKRVPGIPEQRARRQEAEQVLRTRLSWQGTRLVYDTEQTDHWWWLMAGGDVNTARLLLTVLEEPAWQDDLGRLVSGFIARQQGGAWSTTTANLWGSLALAQFSRVHEATPVHGTTQATLAGQRAEVDWTQVTRLKAGTAADPAPSSSGAFGAPAMPGQYIHNTMQLPWPATQTGAQAAPRPDGKPGGDATLVVAHQGSGKPWLTVQALAAVPRTAPLAAGYQIRKTVTPVEQADKSLPAGRHSRGDVLRVKLEVTASADMTWVAITDPVPGGATILGSGLGRDSAIATEGERRSGHGWLAYEERSFEAFRSYYEYLPKGTTTVEYTVRLNNPGTFQLPPSRVEALYAPEMFGEAPNAPVQVQ